MKDKIVKQDELREIVIKLKQKGKKVISTSGCFDIIHVGHVSYLHEAKSFGDILIVMLNSDESVKRLKGPERPINTEFNRALVLSSLEMIDYVCIFSEDTPCNLIRMLSPDIIIKGGDYKGKHIPEMDVAAEYGGKVEFVDFIDGFSTSAILSKLNE